MKLTDDSTPHGRPLRLTFPCRRHLSISVINKGNFFFEHGDTHAADQFGDEVEHHGANYPQRRAEQGCQQAERSEVAEQRRAIERKCFPTERLKEVFDVVDRSGGVRDTPHERHRNQSNGIEHEMKDDADLEHAPHVDVTQYSGDTA